MKMIKHPIDKIEWVDYKKLKANDYNPNIVFDKELHLLEYSIIKQGWIQPILATENFVIIDGFHRYFLMDKSKEMRELSDGKVPVVRLSLSESERMLLTIRINRAKGSHIAIKLHDIIKRLVTDYNISIEDIMREMGATRDEVEVLLIDNVFKALDIEHHQYSKAWIPR
jgi:ParB-like chromosome segregation protein Spo0J